jgi:DNA-binding LacI/PurR family transcriptional regulator
MESTTVLAPPQAPQARVIHSLKQWMNDGALSAGSPLPSERELSERLQVNRGTVRRALQVLQDEGLLRTQNGRIRIVTQAHSAVRAGALRKSVALLAPLFSDQAANEPFHGSSEYIGRGAMEGIRKQGKHAISLNPDCLTREEVRELAQEQPLGVVITDIARSAGRDVELANWFREAGVQVSVYGDAPAIAGFDRVTSDHETGAYALTSHLISRGCRRILNFWSVSKELYWASQRQKGYARAMTEAGLEPLEPVRMPMFPACHGNEERFQDAVRTTAGHMVEYLVGPKAVDALLLTTDNDYYGVAAACRLFGREPQRDIWLAGYDNNPAFETGNSQFEQTRPIATVDKRNEAMGAELVNLLLERAACELPAEPQRRVVAPSLIVREVVR